MTEDNASPETSLVTRDSFASSFDPGDMEEAGKMANWLAKSTLIPEGIRGKPGDILVVMITGRELGLSVMQSLRMISVIRGKPVMDAALIVAMVVQRKDICQYFAILESTNELATYRTHRIGSPEPSTLTYTMEDAAQAGFAGKDNWKKHPAAMLRARCSSALARAIYPDLVANLYESDEGAEMARSEPVRVSRPEAAEPLILEPTVPISSPDAEPPPPTPDRQPGDLPRRGTKAARQQGGSSFYEEENRNPTSPYQNGPCISEGLVRRFWAVCRDRANVLGIKKQEVVKAILDQHRIQSVEMITKSTFDELIAEAENYTVGDKLGRDAAKLTKELTASVEKEDGPPEGQFPE